MNPGLLFLALACTPDPHDSGADCTDATALTWANWADGFFANYCRACHSLGTPDRYDAPEGVDFDSEAEVRNWAERIRVRVLDEGTMPVGGGVYESDLQRLQEYLSCSL